MPVVEPRLVPPPATSRPSVARVADDWYVVCKSSELKKGEPLSRMLLGTPLAIFRTDEGVGALLDRCPHRNVPLSLGRVAEGQLECGYHGWRFDGSGVCRHIPCLVGDPDKKARRTPAHAAKEQDGFVWVYGTADVEPEREPFRFPFMDDDRYTKAGAEIDLEGSIHAAAENALDVPHTAYLHGGWFRKPDRNLEVDVIIRRWADRCEAEYIGEPRPTGLLGKVLAPGGGVVEHFDRFLLPSITQVEYRLGKDSHMMISAAMTPIEDFKTRLFGVVAFKTPIPLPTGALARLLKPVALIVLGQDAKMLKHQSDAVMRFGGEQLVSTDVDVLGPHILRLLKNAEQGKRGDDDESDEASERRIKMRI
jgi:nitrite reductase/ring-hydroxylating ferredoxin subunit